MSRRRGSRFIIASNSESEHNVEMNEAIEEEDEEVDHDLGDDVTKELGAPFKVYEAEADLYKSLAKRDVIAPVNIDYEYWKLLADDGDAFAKKFTRFIRRLKLVKWAKIEENAYPTLMREFYTTVSISGDGTIECRFGVKWCKFTTSDIMDEFGYYASEGAKEGGARDAKGEYIDRDEQYNEAAFWEEIKCLGIGETEGFPLTAVQDNAVYITYHFLAKSVFGKEKIAKIPKEDLYLLWKLLKWRDQDLVEYPETHRFRPINLYPYVLATIKNTCYIKVAKSSKLSLGTMITALAKKKGWNPGTNDKKIEPTPLPLRERLLRTPLRPEGKRVPITFLRKRIDDEDADLKSLNANAPPVPEYVEIFATELAPNVDYAPPPELFTTRYYSEEPAPMDRSPSPAHRSRRIDLAATPDRSPMDRSPPPADRSSAHPNRSVPIDPPEAPIDPTESPPTINVVNFPAPPVFEVPILPTRGPVTRARAKKDIQRPGQGSTLPPHPYFSTGPSVARVSFDGPTRKEYEEFKQETRASHRAILEGQAIVHRYIEEDRAWKKGQRELLELILHGCVGGMEDDEEKMNDEHVTEDPTPSEP
ncbi:hypothetical protein CASFOL_014537 [Castilleja foliolosa]|uniref:Uncharacterized protein n=1 Tax=Castilleja foliolosa TaxID=1961234 RepID=A0ABD3DNS0_9LAMI